MTSSEIAEKYFEVSSKIIDLQKKINDLIADWENHNTVFDTKTIEETVEKGILRLEKLKEEEKDLLEKYLKQKQKEEGKKGADISIRHHLGVTPDDLEITGGVLSNNSNESHLIGQRKSHEQLENEKIQLLNLIKEKVMNKEIPLSLASKLTNDVKTAYGFYEPNPEELLNTNNVQR